MNRRRAALLAGILLLLAVLVGTAMLLTPSTEPTRAELEPELQRQSIRLVERAPPAPAEEGDDVPPVECAMWRTIGDTTEIQLDEVDPDTLESLGWLFPERLSKAMRFVPRNSVGLGWLHVTGHEPAVISWADGSCLDFVELVEHAKVTVSGRVTGVVETGAVSVAARCDGELAGFGSPQPPDAEFELRMPEDADACIVIVRRVFGGRDLLAEYPMAVRAQEGLELAVASPPGVGLGLQDVAEGLRVYGVEPGSAAAEAGIEMMDLVLSVDGEPASDLVADELIEEEGPLLLEVQRDGDTFEVTVGSPGRE